MNSEPPRSTDRGFLHPSCSRSIKSGLARALFRHWTVRLAHSNLQRVRWRLSATTWAATGLCKRKSERQADKADIIGKIFSGILIPSLLGFATFVYNESQQRTTDAYNKSQQETSRRQHYDLPWLVFLHRHTSFPQE